VATEQSGISSPEEILARHQASARVLTGEQPMGWSEWAMQIYESSCLTAAGRCVALWAVDTLQSFLGSDILQRIMEKKQEHPLLLPTYGVWPANDVPWVYANLFQLASQIKLLRPWPLQPAMSQNLTVESWEHAQLQLNLAGLALRAGLGSAFETRLPNGKRADLRISAGSSTLLVEIVAWGFSDAQRKAARFFHELGYIVLGMEMQYGVEIRGSLGNVMAGEHIRVWLQLLKTAAAQTAQDGVTRVVPGPNEGSLRVTKEPPTPGEATLEGAPVTTDIWGRLVARIEDKARQTKDSGPVWLCLADQAGFWMYSPFLQITLAEKLSFLTPLLQEILGALPHIAGIILSPGAMWTGAATLEAVYQVAAIEGATAIRCPLPGHRAKESMIVTRTGLPDPDPGYTLFVDWYWNENTWLDWALEQLGFAPFDTLAHEQSLAANEAYLKSA
jgi:hypothetical protein